ncbi:hypothetical protein ACWCY6_45060 [Streptomyces sp. 900105755]
MDSGTVIAVAATVIALGSFWVSYSQARAAQLHNRQSVRPILQLRHVKAYEDHAAGVRIINAGLGPGIVTRAMVWLDGELVGQWNLETYRAVVASLPVRPKMHSLHEGSVILAGQSIYLLRLEEFNDARHEWFWDLITQRFMIEVHYESVYGGEDFKVALGNLR